MKIAIAHDMIICKGGAERVLLYFHEALPDAPIHTSVYLPDNTYSEFSALDIRTTWYKRIATTEELYRKLYFPFGIVAAKQMDLTEYDVVLLSTTHGAKYAKFRSDALVLAYCYTPFRLAWNPDSYPQVKNAGRVKRILLDRIISLYRWIDYSAAQRPDAYWAMTQETGERIATAYKKKVSKIIHPPVDCKKFFVSENVGDYYLVVSRLEPYKKVDVIVRVFNKLGLPLKIVGRGTQRNQLHDLAGQNIEFIENIDDVNLAILYAECKALIFPQHEDYGLTPLEANASGRPVIAFRDGGVKETMIPWVDGAQKATALFFDRQTEECLTEAILRFDTLRFDPAFMRSHAEKFDKDVFIAKIRSSVYESAKKIEMRIT